MPVHRINLTSVITGMSVTMIVTDVMEVVTALMAQMNMTAVSSRKQFNVILIQFLPLQFLYAFGYKETLFNWCIN